MKFEENYISNILEHVDHVVKINEGVIDCNNICTLGKSSSQNQATDTAESVNSNGSHVTTILKNLKLIIVFIAII